MSERSASDQRTQPEYSPAPSGAGLPADALRDILPEFVQESLDWMAQAEAALLALEAEDATNEEPVNVALRAFHTVKGTSAFIGLDAISALAHDAESLLIPARDDGAAFTRSHADVLLAAADMTRALLELARASVMDDAEVEMPAGYSALRARMGADGADGIRDDDGAAVDAGRDAPRTSDEWTRVRTERLDQLLDLVGELVVAQSMVAQDSTVQRERHGDLASRVLRTSKIVRELQSLGIGLRTVPLRPLFQRMHRLVREVSHQSGKPVLLVTEGADTEIDRTMVDVLTDPLVHMIRNAVDHGIEPAVERNACGKPSQATLRLTARQAGGSVIIEFGDDGCGLDCERILQRALDRGISVPASERGDADVWPLIFAPGLSTAERVTDLSGRGVGMDVVQRGIEALHGRIEIDSVRGAGTTFTIRLPLTLAITDGLLVRVGMERYIVPSTSVASSFRPEPSAVIDAAGGAEMVMLQERALPVLRLHRLFDVGGAVTEPTHGVLVVIDNGTNPFALLVDDLLGQQQFVAKPLANGLGDVDGLAGSAVLGDGRVGLILDPAELRTAAALPDQVARSRS